ncbi:MAG: hypothetical protein U1F05_09505 [Burkholderiales bacterium]
MLLNKDFEEFIELLRSNGVEFLVVGAHALAAHGRPRYTGDLDLWVRPESTNISGLSKPLMTSDSRRSASPLKIS